jgi:hypothetical protein
VRLRSREHRSSLSVHQSVQLSIYPAGIIFVCPYIIAVILLVTAVTETTLHVMSCKQLQYVNVSCCIDADKCRYLPTSADAFEF